MSMQRLQNAAWRVGVRAAASALLVSELDRRLNRQKPKDPDQDENSVVYPDGRNAIPLLDPVVSNCSAPAMSSSPESSPFWERRNVSRGRARLARHRTIRMMEDTSTKSSLESRYAVNWEDPLGEGGFGAVYSATDKATGQAVALKKITKEYTDDRGFQREMNALNNVRRAGGHPNICGLLENFDEGDHYYLALDLVCGGEMFDHLVELGAYSEADAARLVREVASALAFLHGIDCVHGDLKPENLMLSSTHSSNAIIKLVDFGSSQVRAEDSTLKSEAAHMGNTPAYCPPEVLGEKKPTHMDPSLDMWSLGVILYIMLTGVHPFDLEGDSTDPDVIHRIVSRKPPPLRNSIITEHLSDSALDLIEKLLTCDPDKRLTALEMLEHPWVRGETARHDKMSAKKLSMFRVFKSGLEARVFANIVSWSDDAADQDTVSQKMSLIARSFHSLDPQRKGFITTKDLRRISGDGQHSIEADADNSMSLSEFENLLSDNMKNKYFPKGHVVFREGDVGNHMYFINSGTVEESNKDGWRSQRMQGDFFGAGSLLHPSKTRSASVKCATPVHLIEINREYFDKYLAKSEVGLKMTMKETDKMRRRNRAISLLRLQSNIEPLAVKKGDYFYKMGEEAKDLYILENGLVDVKVGDHTVFTVDHPGNMCGEHALVTGRPRNTSAVCVSDTCKVLVMRGQDFHQLMNESASLKESLHDICLRREFLKAIVFKTEKPFPSDPKELKEAFEAADEDSSGKISLENVRTMLRRYDPTITEEDLKATIKSLDLDESGVVSFEEFKRIFGMNGTAAVAK